MMLGALGMLLSSAIRQLENFAGVMNFVIFPMFFASSALYPLWLVQQSSPVVYTICRLNPFTYAVELIRFALYLEIDWMSLAVVACMTVVFTAGAIIAYDPARGLIARRGGGAWMTRSSPALHCGARRHGADARRWQAHARHRRAPRDPDWPCQQIKVPQLSLASVWSGPPVDAQQDDWQARPQVADWSHAARASAACRWTRRRQKIHAFAQQAGTQKQAQPAGSCSPACSDVAGRGARQRHRRPRPLRRTPEGTRGRAARRTTRSCGHMQADASIRCGAIEPADAARHSGRRRCSRTGARRSSYACDVPAKIEQRLFALARTIQEALQ